MRDEILVQPLNTGEDEEPIVEQFSALKTTDVRPLQPEKAYSPIDVTELGMVTDVRPLKCLKAKAGIVLTPSPIVRDEILLQPSNTGKPKEPIVEQFSALKTTDVRPLQPLKADSPIEVTELGMVIAVRPLQP